MCARDSGCHDAIELEAGDSPTPRRLGKRRQAVPTTEDEDAPAEQCHCGCRACCGFVSLALVGVGSAAASLATFGTAHTFGGNRSVLEALGMPAFEEANEVWSDLLMPLSPPLPSPPPPPSPPPQLSLTRARGCANTATYHFCTSKAAHGHCSRVSVAVQCAATCNACSLFLPPAMPPPSPGPTPPPPPNEPNPCPPPLWSL